MDVQLSLSPRQRSCVQDLSRTDNKYFKIENEIQKNENEYNSFYFLFRGVRSLKPS
jgi:hypothetical protein